MVLLVVTSYVIEGKTLLSLPFNHVLVSFPTNRPYHGCFALFLQPRVAAMFLGFFKGPLKFVMGLLNVCTQYGNNK